VSLYVYIDYNEKYTTVQLVVCMTRNISYNLQQHLEQEHAISPLTQYVREIVYGGVDGIVTTFAVVAGFAGATGGGTMETGIPVVVVLLFGGANLFADAVSMALGNYMSVRADHDLYRSELHKEASEIKKNPSMEFEETVSIFIDQGFTKDQATQLTSIYQQNKKGWAEFMMTNELRMEHPDNTNPLFTSIATCLSFIVFGTVPLIPYIVVGSDGSLFIWSVAATALALFLLGTLRMRITKTSAVRSVGEIVLLGSVAAVIAYIVGTFFST